MLGVFYPAVVCVALVVVVVIIIMLRFGSRLCGLRHQTFVDEDGWREPHYEPERVYIEEGRAYDQEELRTYEQSVQAEV